MKKIFFFLLFPIFIPSYCYADITQQNITQNKDNNLIIELFNYLNDASFIKRYDIYTTSKVNICNSKKNNFPESAGKHVSVGDIYQLNDGTVVQVTKVKIYSDKHGVKSTGISTYIDNYKNIIPSGLKILHYGINTRDLTGQTIIRYGDEYNRGTYVYPGSIKDTQVFACLVTSGLQHSTRNVYSSLLNKNISNSKIPLPSEFGIKMDGTEEDSRLIQIYVDLYSPNVMNLNGLWWQTDSNQWNNFDGMFHINHNQNKTGTFWNFTGTGGIHNSQNGDTLTSFVADGDLQETYHHSGLHFDMVHQKGQYYGPMISETFTNSSPDQPHFYNSGEYGNIVIHNITSNDNATSGQNVLLSLNSNQKISKGFSSQTQSIEFQNNAYAKDNYWALVGGDTDYTWEKPLSAFEMVGWEMDMTGSGPELTPDCNVTPNTNNCGRYGIDIGADNTIDTQNQSPISWQASTSYSAVYGFYGTQLQYDPISSAHVLVANGTFTDGSVKYAVFRAVPPNGTTTGMTQTYTATSAASAPAFLSHLDGIAFAEDASNSNSVWWQYVGDNTFEFGLGITFDGHKNSYYGTGLSAVDAYFKNAFIDVHAAKGVDSDFSVFRVPTDVPVIDFMPHDSTAHNQLYLTYSSADKALEFVSGGNSVLRADTSGNLSINGTMSVPVLSSQYGISTGYGDISAGGNLKTAKSLYLGVMSKSAILALSSPVEGQKVFDSDDHGEVTYRCPNATNCGWYPVQYDGRLK